MSIIFLAILTLLIILARFAFFNLFLRKYPGVAKIFGYCVLLFVTGIFLFFPTCIFLGNEVCWDYDVATHKTVLLVASFIIILLCGWAWFKIIKDPKLESSSSKPVAALIITLTIIVGLIILVFGTSSYWAPLVGK